MALLFTTIPDHIGPAVYMLGGTDSHTEEQIMQLGEEIIYRCNQQTQVVVLDPRKGDGLRVKEFYAISELPCVMIVMDDDTITHQWTISLPKAEEVTYVLSHIKRPYALMSSSLECCNSRI